MDNHQISMNHKTVSIIAKLALLLIALLIALILNSCGQSKTNQLTRSDSVIVAKQTITQAIKTNDSLQAKKDSIPLTRTHAERDTFWANLKRSLF